MVKKWVQNIISVGSLEPFLASHESEIGKWIRLEDYESLQAALREALDGWEAEMHADLTGHQRKRIDALRAQFLDDK